MNTNDLKYFETTAAEQDLYIPDNACFNRAIAESRITTFDVGITEGKSGSATLSKRVQIVDTDTGFPLENVHIIVNGKGTITNADGYATINAVNENDMVSISHVAYGKKSFVFKNLGSYINLDALPMTQQPVVVTSTPATPLQSEKQFNWMKWAAIAIGAIAVLSMLSGDDEKPKAQKVKV